jgi:hypothetical protein
MASFYIKNIIITGIRELPIAVLLFAIIISWIAQQFFNRPVPYLCYGHL